MSNTIIVIYFGFHTKHSKASFRDKTKTSIWSKHCQPENIETTTIKYLKLHLFDKIYEKVVAPDNLQ